MATNHCPQCGGAVSGEDRFCPACGTTLARPKVVPGQTAPGRSKFPLAILAIASIGLLLIAGGLLLNRDEEPQTVVEPPAVPEPARPDEELPFPDVPRIPLEEAAAGQLGGDLIFVDVRDSADYAEAHIPGARSIPLGDVEMDPAYRELPVDAEIVTYCT